MTETIIKITVKVVVAAAAAAITTVLTGCTVPVPVTDVNSDTRYSDVTVDEKDLNDEAFDMAWDQVAGSDPQMAADLCYAAQTMPDQMWAAFDKGSNHTFTREVWERGIYRHCP